MVSLAITLFGTTTKLPAFVNSLVARQVISLTLPSWAPIVTQSPTRNGFSICIASPENRFPSVSCSANPSTTAPTAVVARMRSRRMQRGHDREQHDEQRILHDAGKPIGKPIDIPGIEREGDDHVDDGKRRNQGLMPREQLPRVFGERKPVERDGRQHVGGEQAGREEQPAANMTVDRRPAYAKRRQQERETDDDAERHAGLGDPLLERREVGRRDRRLHQVRVVAAFGETIRHPLRERRPTPPPAARFFRRDRLREVAETETLLLFFRLLLFGFLVLGFALLAAGEPRRSFDDDGDLRDLGRLVLDVRLVARRDRGARLRARQLLRPCRSAPWSRDATRTDRSAPADPCCARRAASESRDRPCRRSRLSARATMPSLSASISSPRSNEFSSTICTPCSAS